VEQQHQTYQDREVLVYQQKFQVLQFKELAVAEVVVMLLLGQLLKVQVVQEAEDKEVVWEILQDLQGQQEQQTLAVVEVALVVQMLAQLQELVDQV
tara:strand:- start:14 stop:301 length:288 start_codon:yes stop_codon:yes gene_type:complete